MNTDLEDELQRIIEGAISEHGGVIDTDIPELAEMIREAITSAGWPRRDVD